MKLRLLTSLIALSLTACNGSDNSEEKTPAIKTSTLSGKAANGYLVGANVCLDLNKNGKCESNEPITTTAANGVYKLTIGQFDQHKYPLVVEVTESTIDEDTNQPVGKAYTLSAPAAKGEFISPISTLVHYLMKQYNLELEEATTLLKAQLRYLPIENIDLLEDYIANKTHEQGLSYKKLHQVAQVTAMMLAENQSEVLKKLSEMGDDPANAHQVLSTKALNEIKAISSYISEIDPDELITSAKIPSINLEIGSELEALIARTKLARQANEDFEIAEAYLGGLYTFNGHKSHYGAYVRASAYQWQKETDNSYTQFFAHHTKSPFQEEWQAPVTSIVNYDLTKEGWKLNHSKSGQINGQITTQKNQWIYLGDNSSESSRFTEIDLTNVDIQKVFTTAMLDVFDQGNNSSALFSAGAKAYKAVHNFTQDHYSIEANYDDKCREYSSFKYQNETTICEAVSYNIQLDYIMATSLDQLFDANDGRTVNGAILKRETPGSLNGVAIYEVTSWNHDQQEQEVVSTYKGSWEITEPYPGNPVLSVTYPETTKLVARNNGGYIMDSWYAVIDGYVRHVWKQNAGDIQVNMDGFYYFNEIAARDIDQALNIQSPAFK